ncbi:MAG: diaminopimelate epimerase [Woeseiaceae bacterium]|nr:diaminopimelate epimerase [Woeseiaceae bacterium]
MQLAYFKMHGTGNRIVVVDERRSGRPPPSPQQIRRLGDDATGPGFDQLMWVTAAEPPAAARYRVFNADGSEVEQCGNGVRCVARLLAGDGQAELLLESPAGPIEARLGADGQVSVNMGAPVFEPARIPFEADAVAERYLLQVLDRDIEVSVLSMGNPHCVIDVDDVEAADVAGIGPVIENHARFPRKANVGFMAVRDDGEIDLRVHERGVGETLACGTGACAAAVSAMRRGLVAHDAAVNLPGGQVMVSWRGDAGPVWLTGNAELISEGTIDL